ncbi:MAG: hypothetical protein IT559_01560 [Alphaproteobacteria bacterium]|nr:hypothetical protein [Alphaproteobacteria bacterium]
MAVVNWNESRQGMDVCSHEMSGKPANVPFDETYTQLVDPKTREVLESFLEQALPNKSTSVVGAPWDYSQSEIKDLHAGTPVGHYRVNIGNLSAVLCVDIHDTSEAIALGAAVFDEYSRRRIINEGPIAFSGKNYVKPIVFSDKSYYAHLQQRFSSYTSLFNSTARLGGQQKQLGKIIGGMYKAGENLKPAFKKRLEKFTDDVTMQCVDVGSKLLTEDALKNLVDVDGYADILRFPKIVQKDMPEVLGNRRVANSFNAIDKMFKMHHSSKLLIFSGYDAVSRGYVPMMSENATHDAANALARIIVKPVLYDEGGFQNHGSKQDQIQKGIQNFVDGYNETSGLKLTFEEAVASAEHLSVFQLYYGLGYNALSGEKAITGQDLKEHIKAQVIPQMQNLDAIRLNGPS